MMHRNPPFRAEHIGSLKRPQDLLAKRQEFENNQCTAEELKAVEDKAIEAAVKMQRKAGIKSITDGEFRRHMFFDGVFDNLEGMTLISDVPPTMFKMYVPDVAAFQKLSFKKADSWICTGKLKRTKSFYVEQFEGLKQFVEPEEVPNLKITVCAPEWFHLRHGEHAFSTDAYKNDADYFADIVKAYVAEFHELHSRGCRNVQFDDPLLAYFCSESMLKGMEEEGVQSEQLLDLYVKVYNDILSERPEGMTFGLHLCRGNFKGGVHFSEGGYDRIAIKLFNELQFDCYYLEYDTERAGSFAPLMQLPANKSVVLGLISSKLPDLEDIEYLGQRVREAAAAIAEGREGPTGEAMECLAISPQCGFASHSDGNEVTGTDVERKLHLVSKAAQHIWKY